VAVLPGAVLLERRPLELTDVDVVEQRLDGEGDLTAGERDLGRLTRAREPCVDTKVERNVGDLRAELPCLLATLLGQVDAARRVAVEAAFDVEDGLGVTGDDEETHCFS
jgi:hypothetical protein